MESITSSEDDGENNASSRGSHQPLTGIKFERLSYSIGKSTVDLPVEHVIHPRGVAHKSTWVRDSDEHNDPSDNAAWQPVSILKKSTSCFPGHLGNFTSAIKSDSVATPTERHGKQRWRLVVQDVIHRMRIHLQSEPPLSEASAAEEGDVTCGGDKNAKSNQMKAESHWDRCISVDSGTVQPEYSRQRGCSTSSTASLFDPWHDFLVNCIPMEMARRYRFSSLHQRWIIDEVRVKLESTAFDHGAMRECFRMKKLPNSGAHRNDWRFASNYVAKRYIKEDTDRGVYFEDVRLQMEAKLWAERFNRYNPPKKVDVFQVCVVEFTGRVGMPLYQIERYMDGTYKKYNSNSGFVEETDCRNTPQAFSHFTFEHSDHHVLIVDIQGVDDLYTDPQIHTSNSQGYGDGNLGPRGMALFFHSHRCNNICEYLGLKEFQLADSEKMKSNSGSEMGVEESADSSTEGQESPGVHDWDLLPSSNDEEENADEMDCKSMVDVCVGEEDMASSTSKTRRLRTRCFSTGDQATQVRRNPLSNSVWAPLQQHVYLNHAPQNLLTEGGNSWYCSFESVVHQCQSAVQRNQGGPLSSPRYAESGFADGEESGDLNPPQQPLLPQDDLETMLFEFSDAKSWGEPVCASSIGAHQTHVGGLRRTRGISTCSEDIDCLAGHVEETLEDEWPPHAVEWLRNKFVLPKVEPWKMHQQDSEHISPPSRSNEDKCEVLAQIHLEMATLHSNGRFAASRDGNMNVEDAVDWSACLFHMRRAADLGCPAALWELVCFAESRSQLLQSAGCAVLSERVLKMCPLSPEAEDEDKTMQYLRKVAQAGGHPIAMFVLARTFEKAGHCEMDLGQALEWYQKALEAAAEMEDVELPWAPHEVMAHMAQLWAEGGPGLGKNVQRAGEMYSEAAESATAAMKGRLASKYFALAEECFSTDDGGEE